LSFPFLKQRGPRGHTNSRANPHFSLIRGQAEVRARWGTEMREGNAAIQSVSKMGGGLARCSGGPR
jgi:hypothetical protein